MISIHARQANWITRAKVDQPRTLEATEHTHTNITVWVMSPDNIINPLKYVKYLQNAAPIASPSLHSLKGFRTFIFSYYNVIRYIPLSFTRFNTVVPSPLIPVTHQC